MSGGGGGTSTTHAELPPELRPLATAYANRAMQMSNTPFTPYGGQRFADFSTDQQAAMGIARDRALNGSPVQDQANQTLIQNLQGGQTNPFLDAMVKRAQDSLTPQQDMLRSRSGSFGNSGVEEANSKAMGDIATQMYGQAYEGDRQRQMQALQMAPTYSNQAYTDASQLFGMGQAQQNLGQQRADFAFQQFQDQQNQPYKNLQVLGAPFSMNLGGVTTTNSSGGGK